MNVAIIETLFTTSLRLWAPWEVRKEPLNMAKHRIEFTVSCEVTHFPV